MSFLDTYCSYHQIPIFGPNQEKTTFISPRGTYCYKVMPFDLKNAGATYQRMVTKMFNDQLAKTMEAYIDDKVLKSKLAEHHLRGLEEVFHILKTHKLRLNASKCAFRIGSGKFLRYIMTKCASKSTSTRSKPSKTLRHIQRLRNSKSSLVWPQH
ncbi:hypothetical protein CsSME_00011814 [Camellia sinensis var. sinensis]